MNRSTPGLLVHHHLPELHMYKLWFPYVIWKRYQYYNITQIAKEFLKSPEYHIAKYCWASYTSSEKRWVFFIKSQIWCTLESYCLLMSQYNTQNYTLGIYSIGFYQNIFKKIDTMSFSRNHIWWLVLDKSREGNGTPLQYSCLENPMDRGAWWAAVHRVAKSRTRLSDFTFTFYFHALEKEMATHSSVLACRIPGTESFLWCKFKI